MPQGGSISGTTQDIQEPEPSEPKDAFVSPVRPIKALALSRRNAGGCQVRRPPDGQKEGEQQPLQMSAIRNPAGLNIEAAALGHGAKDLSAVILPMEEIAGVKVGRQRP